MLVDMESATIVRLAKMRGIPVCCMKIITDDVNAKLPNLNPFIDAMGQMKMARFIGHVLLRPGYWPGLVRMGRASANGANYLASAILHFLIHDKPRNVHEIIRTGVIPD
jgi:adenosylhomocysteine nucleosidase